MPPEGHPCRRALKALEEAGYDPEVKRTYGWGRLPSWANPMRREVRRLTGQDWVPVLVDDAENVVAGSQRIVDWARANPVTGA
jgi:hypothetical protein